MLCSLSHLNNSNMLFISTDFNSKTWYRRLSQHFFSVEAGIAIHKNQVGNSVRLFPLGLLGTPNKVFMKYFHLLCRFKSLAEPVYLTCSKRPNQAFPRAEQLKKMKINSDEAYLVNYLPIFSTSDY